MSLTQSVVLSCAGIGSRLGLAQTKALVQIMGKSIIGWQMEIFAEVEDLRIVVGYQAMEVVREVREYRNDAIFVYNHDYFHTKTGRSYLLGGRHGNELAVAWDGDLLVHPDDARRLLSMRREYVAYTEPTSDEPIFVDVDAAGNVVSFSDKEGGYEWSGPCCVRKDRLQERGVDVYHMLEPLLPLPGVKIRAQDIDTYDDYKRAENFIRSW
ncbi:MAG: NTP transferase domain-containing protein [Desulfovibrio sp.]|jgi:choline kinase|nr:NTP transferase domain-containing protein [Desulfovibrio sp.]